MNDWRLKFGKITASVWSTGAEFRQMMPPGADIYTVTLNVVQTDEENLSRARELRHEAVEVLDQWDVDCIVAGGAPVSAKDGIEAEKAFLEESRSKLSIPFTTSLRAQIDAFEALDVDSIVGVTPFTSKNDEWIADYIEYFGIDVIKLGGPSIEEVAAMSELSSTASYRYAKELISEIDREYDAIYVPCVPFGGVKYIHPLEEDTGYPVVMSSQAQLWKAMDMAGVSADIEGYGELFNTL